jgi:hypothetical protein
MRVILPRGFMRRVKQLGLDDDDLAELINSVAANPAAGPVIPGTGGARKLRVRLPGRGKRGGARVIYAIVLRATAMAFLDLYAKNAKADLTASERKMIATLVHEIETGKQP